MCSEEACELIVRYVEKFESFPSVGKPGDFSWFCGLSAEAMTLYRGAHNKRGNVKAISGSQLNLYYLHFELHIQSKVRSRF